MERDNALEILRKHAAELRAAGVVHLHLFGSVARGEASSHSDVDLFADFDSSRVMTLVSVAGLENHLGDLLGTRVELSSLGWMKSQVRDQALREAICAF